MFNKFKKKSNKIFEKNWNKTPQKLVDKILSVIYYWKFKKKSNEIHRKNRKKFKTIYCVMKIEVHKIMKKLDWFLKKLNFGLKNGKKHWISSFFGENMRL